MNMIKTGIRIDKAERIGQSMAGRLSMWIHFAGVFLVASSIGHAQDAAEPPKQKAADNPQVRRAIRTHQRVLERRLALRIADLQRTCRLSDAQVRKLEIAAKGAVSKTVAQYRKQFSQIPGAPADFAFPGPGDVAIEVDPGEGEDEELAIADGPEILVWQNAGVMSLFGVTNGANVEASPIWKSSLSKTLTKEQSALYAAAKKQREEFQRNAAVDAFVARVDRRLLLGPAQRAKLRTIIDESIGDRLRTQLEQAEAGWGGVLVEILDESQAPIPRAKLKEILSPAQLAEWQQTFERQIRQLPIRPMFGGGFRPAANPDRGILGVQLRMDGDKVAIRSVLADSSAKAAGLEEDDVILEIDDEAVATVEDVVTSISSKKPGDKVELKIDRAGETSTIEATLRGIGD